MRVLDDSIQLQTFSGPGAAEALKANYRAVRARRDRAHLRVVPASMPEDAPKPVKPRKPPVINLPAFLPARGAEWFEVRAIGRHKIPTLITMTAAQFEMTETDIIAHRRHIPIVYARQCAMWLCRRFTIFSFPAIADRFSGRDHTTAIHGVRKIDRIIAERGITVSDETPALWLKALHAARPGRDAS